MIPVVKILKKQLWMEGRKGVSAVVLRCVNLPGLLAVMFRKKGLFFVSVSTCFAIGCSSAVKRWTQVLLIMNYMWFNHCFSWIDPVFLSWVMMDAWRFQVSSWKPPCCSCSLTFVQNMELLGKCFETCFS